MRRSQGSAVGVIVAVVLVACLSVLWPPSACAQAAPPPADPVAAALQQLDAMAPGVETLDARYKLTSVSTADGVDASYERRGRIFVDHGAVAVLRFLSGEVPEMQLVYKDGALLRWFPFSHYAHRVIAESWDKDDTDFGMVWRPFLVHLAPGRELKALPGLTVSPKAADDTFDGLLSDADQAAELAARPKDAKLESWGPRPDLTVHAGKDGRVDRVDSVHFKDGGSGPVEAKRQTVRLTALQVAHGVVIPARIELEAFLPGQTAPYRKITVELSDLHVNEPLPADAFQPQWPADTLFVDVETQKDTAYLPTADRPESMIELADFYLGTGKREAGLQWIETLRKSIGDRPPSPFEVGNLARLDSRAGLKDEGLKLHLTAIRQAQDALAAKPGDPDAEILLVRYYTEYAYFLARGAGRRLDGETAAFLAGKIADLRTPAAIARLSGRAADHYATADHYDKAREVLAAAQKSAAADPAALVWVESCWTRLAEAQSRDEHLARVKAKLAKIAGLRKAIQDLAAKPGAAADAKAGDLRAELRSLEAKP